MTSISLKKDVDGLSAENIGNMIIGKECIVPCTPLACIHLIKTIESDISGKSAVVIGTSDIVGKPMIHLLLQNMCTVTVMHIKSRYNDLKMFCSNADILVVAIGKHNVIPASFIKKGAIVIDVGINYIKSLSRNKIVGDIDFDEAKKNC